MSLKIAFSSSKGGCGKSTCTILTASALSQPPFNYSVCVADLDRQQSIFEKRQNDIEDKKPTAYDVQKFDLKEFDNSILALDKKYDIVFLDSAGKLDNHLPVEFQEVTRVLSNIDILLIPFTAGNFSLESTIDYINFVTEFNEKRKKPFEVYGFINRFKEGLKTNSDLAINTKKIQDATGIKFMRTRLKNYTLFETADTSKSLYNENASKVDRLNLTVFINELHNKILTN